MRILRPQLIQVAWRQMLRYRLRSALIVGCAALGVGGAITVVNYASSGREEILDQQKTVELESIDLVLTEAGRCDRLSHAHISYP